ncbi:uncharacterized protein LOC129033004 [Pongo pygmaeus]|uniref:uncharacterized protein LOC129033004 n=1 Tax=Pongo pygmaeus TaxID=9600 RepID=UPI00300D0100
MGPGELALAASEKPIIDSLPSHVDSEPRHSYQLPFFSPQHTDLAGRSLLPAPTLMRRLPSPRRCSAPVRSPNNRRLRALVTSQGTATHAEPIGTRGGAAGSSRSAHERTLATGGRWGCNRLLSWQFCVPRLRPGRSRTYAARRSFTTSRSLGPGAARARLCPSRRCAPTGWHLSQKVQPIALSRRSSSMASSSCSPSRPLASPEPGFCLVTLSGPQFSISRGERSIQMPHPPARPSLLLLTRCHILLSGPASFSSPDATSSCPARPPSPHRIPHPPARPGLLLLTRCHILLSGPASFSLSRCHILLPGPASFSSPAQHLLLGGLDPRHSRKRGCPCTDVEAGPPSWDSDPALSQREHEVGDPASRSPDLPPVSFGGASLGKA